MANVCPVCGKDDAIRKVSSTFASGQSQGNVVGSTVGVVTSGDHLAVGGGPTYSSANFITLLAKKLAPPPPAKGLSGCLWALAIYPGIVIPAIPVSAAWNMLSNAPVALNVIVVTLVAIGSLILYFGFLRRVHLNKLRTSEARYKIGMEFWNRLYYCFRDDVVFDPDSGDKFSSDALTSVMEARYQRSLEGETAKI